MLDLQQEIASFPPVEIHRAAPSQQPCAPSSDSEVVVCARPQEEYRLRPLPPRPGKPGWLQRPHVIRLAPNVTVGLHGDGKGPGLHAKF